MIKFLMPSHPLSKFLLQRAHDAVIPQADYLTTSIPSTLSHHAALRLSFPQPNANKSQDGVLAQVIESSFKLSWDQGCAARKPFLWCLRSHLEPPAFTTVTHTTSTIKLEIIQTQRSRWDFAYGTCWSSRALATPWPMVSWRISCPGEKKATT